MSKSENYNLVSVSLSGVKWLFFTPQTFYGISLGVPLASFMRSEFKEELLEWALATVRQVPNHTLGLRCKIEVLTPNNLSYNFF